MRDGGTPWRTLGIAIASMTVLGMASAAGAQTRLRVRSDQDGLSVHRLTGSHDVPVMSGRVSSMVRVDDFELVCRAPCTRLVPTEPTTFGVSSGNGSAVRAGGEHRLYSGDLLLDVRYDDRTGTRVAGVITWIGGVLAGGAMAVVAILNGIDVPLLATGCVIAGLSIVIGAPIAFLVGDSAEARLLSDSEGVADRLDPP